MEFVQEKLTEWGLAKFIEKFEENEIDQETFFLLEPATVMELIQPVGPRLKFLRELQKLKMQVMGDGDNAGPGDVDQDQVEKDDEVPCKKSRHKEPEPQAAVGKEQALRCRSDKIRDILNRAKDGVKLIAEMETGLITPQPRKRIVGILVSYLIEQHGKYPRTAEKLKMAQSIVKEFPQLNNSNGDGYAVWFSPTVGSHDATGYLEIRLRNVRKRDPVKEERPTSKKPLPRVQLSQDDEDEDTVSSMVTWLQNHYEPKDQVKSFMARTCRSRALLVQSDKTKTARDIIAMYPRLIDCKGMIDQDFRILFENSADALFEKWPKISARVLKYAEKQVQWKKILNVEEPHSDAEKTNLSLQVLPMLFPAGVRKQGKRSIQRATVEESIRGFVNVEKVGTNIPAYLEKTQEPHVLLLGERLAPEQAFAIVERNAFPCASLLKAIDILFKLSYILDINYSWKCSHTYVFLQKSVYGLGMDAGPHSPSVALLNNYIEQE